jgi:hypothetical protein
VYAREGLSIHTYSQGFDFDNESDLESSTHSRSALGSPAREKVASGALSSPLHSRTNPGRLHSTASDESLTPAAAVAQESAEATFSKLRDMRIEVQDDQPNDRTASRTRTLTADSNFATSVAASKPLYYTLPLLLHRSFLNMSRQPALCANRISQGTFYGLILSCFYAPMGDDQNSIQDRIGSLYECTALMFIGMLSCIAIFPTERNVFYREYVDGDYSALAFFLTYYAIAVPFILVTAVVVGALLTYAVGLQPEPTALLIFSSVIFSFIFTGECVGVIFCSLFMHVGFSVNVMSVVLSIFGTYPLYFCNVLQLSGSLQWRCMHVNYTSVTLSYLFPLTICWQASWPGTFPWTCRWPCATYPTCRPPPGAATC